MKLISLNTWGGTAGKDILLDFFVKYKDIDVFCLQEIWSGGEDFYKPEHGIDISKITFQLIDEIKKVLPNHDSYFRPVIDDHYGLAIFIKKDINVMEEGDVFVHKYKEYIPEGNIARHARNMQYIKLDLDGPKTIFNFHGLWNGEGKGDSDDRMLQSKNIVNFIKETNNPFILAGDFNLLPETQNLKKIEKLDVENLISKYNIKSTRTSLYNKDVPFADYVFTSREIKLKDFKVMKEEVSDHSALYLEF